MDRKNKLITSESVTEGHPDKVCDQISDAVLDEIYEKDPNPNSARVACETFITRGMVIVGGEITTEAWIDVEELVRRVIKEIGYTDNRYGFNYENCAVLNAIGRQSPDIAQGVNRGGAGDQGLMVGYACNETTQLMPLPIMLAHKLTMRLKEVREKKILEYLGPDGKSQVTVEYKNGKPARIDAVVLSTQHLDTILDSTGKKITKKAWQEIKEVVIDYTLNSTGLIDSKTKFYINPTGKFVIGGPQSDTGMTGRKIIVDTYGGIAPHGGGAFSGKDPTKVDRSAAYMARYLAKNIVASGAASECTVQIAYAIGVKEPVGLYVDTHGTGLISDEELVKIIKKNFDLSPQGIIKSLDLIKPIYRKTAAYGHFGREIKEFTWEKIDKLDIFKGNKVIKKCNCDVC
ncbi:MAG: methionine adenosyltransferase [Elusimicrobiales bacterium]|nr:methionine adenosyltransferase [Elusimicrobiales bacterium]